MGRARTSLSMGREKSTGLWSPPADPDAEASTVPKQMHPLPNTCYVPDRRGVTHENAYSVCQGVGPVKDRLSFSPLSGLTERGTP
jgi:hypothetical protein